MKIVLTILILALLVIHVVISIYPVGHKDLLFLQQHGLYASIGFVTVLFIVNFFCFGSCHSSNNDEEKKDIELKNLADRIVDKYYEAKESNYVDAILIDAPWGSGKTTFYKKYLGIALENKFNKKPLFVSCFDLKTIDQLIAKILYKIAPLEWFGLFGGVARNILHASTQLKQMLIPEKSIIVLDDFERADEEIYRQLLGFMDELKQEKHITFIVLCDHEKVKNKPNYSELDEKVFVKEDYVPSQESIVKVLLQSPDFLNQRHISSERDLSSVDRLIFNSLESLYLYGANRNFRALIKAYKEWRKVEDKVKQYMERYKNDPEYIQLQNDIFTQAIEQGIIGFIFLKNSTEGKEVFDQLSYFQEGRHYKNKTGMPVDQVFNELPEVFKLRLSRYGININPAIARHHMDPLCRNIMEISQNNMHSISDQNYPIITFECVDYVFPKTVNLVISGEKPPDSQLIVSVEKFFNALKNSLQEFKMRKIRAKHYEINLVAYQEWWVIMEFYFFAAILEITPHFRDVVTNEIKDFMLEEMAGNIIYFLGKVPDPLGKGALESDIPPDFQNFKAHTTYYLNPMHRWIEEAGKSKEDIIDNVYTHIREKVTKQISNQ